jgi:thymidylate synthase/dihydrofolate reductase
MFEMASTPSIELIAAVSKNGVIGIDNTLPWSIPEDLRHFRQLTTGHCVIMGYNTWISLPDTIRPLPNRINIVLCREPAPASTNPNVCMIRNDPSVLREILQSLSTEDPDRKFYVIGGATTYRSFLHDPTYPKPTTLHITHIDKAIATTGITSYFPFHPNFNITFYSEKFWSPTEQCHYQYLTYHHSPVGPTADNTYTALIQDILSHGHNRTDRTGTGTTSVFGRQLHFDISNSIPLLTTKYVPWKSVIKELLWFLRGNTDASTLAADGVRIWDGNTSRAFLDSRGLNHLPEGDIGAGYGFQWRHFGGTYQTCKETYDNTIGFDQVAAVLHQLRTDPFSRRIFMSAWNPAALADMALPPCHVSVQFYVEEDTSVPEGQGRRHLSCHMYQRSVDTFLGLPFNIMSYATLTHIFATLTNMTPKELIISTGDTHIYADHIEQVKTQCQRNPYSSPLLLVNPSITGKALEEITVDDFDVVGYFHHGVLKGKMAV